ncbi:MAG: sigma 54-interacting transcriptional regulator [Clostridium sp.]|uniref:sigma 54-interacting transcriptional regulator n=1 Tax=Clostridium sp. TaxID=1506 RepID=UPI00290E90BE|nr:sigma 54-interacting transcriptional regulator [Clostridium sp.]MDU5110941.1 sigma 54-interacting transcriptional regulator [Clostridium sp.]
MSKISEVLDALKKLDTKSSNGVTASDVSAFMNLDRANVSRYLNKLYKEGAVSKSEGHPVKYSCVIKVVGKGKSRSTKVDLKMNTLDTLVGAKQSLEMAIQQAKAAILYPPRGLHTLILGETGVGKSMFAEAMYNFAKESEVIEENGPFIRFNCADYADNPQLVMAQIFGVKKGAYTGADSDKDGLLKKANGGILFLDEIHRLSPQGQEMLFTYIDKGFFRVLGDTENLVHVEAQIICATTEDPQSFLLKTFTRRIPMAITLPSLKEKTIKERYYLLREFIENESHRVSKSIYFNKSALISFLLYDCPNNIGQLKSDIQLSCARAFLKFKAKSKDYILVEQEDLHQRVKLGLMKLQDYRDEIDEILSNMGDVLKFCYDDKINIIEDETKLEEIKEGAMFYDRIEKKIEELKKEGIEEKEIDEILNIDIEKYFRKYIRDLPDKFKKEELSKAVDGKIIDLVEEILVYASKKLNREFDIRVYYGLALHIQGSLERIRKGIKIFHPRLNFIRGEYAKEFIVSMEIATIIDKKLGIEIPLDEIGYITMFLATNPYEKDRENDDRVAVLVIMHGHSTASSMVEVANSLIGEDYVKALDMPLSMKAEDMYRIVKEKVKEINNNKGVFILVDMGSLTNFADMIKEELDIKVKTLDMVTTLLVIEAGRKAINGRSLNEIYEACFEIKRYGIQGLTSKIDRKENIIVTSCFTGDGSAQRLKEIIENNMNSNSNIKIYALNIIDKDDFYSNLDSLSKKYNIIAIVGVMNTYYPNIPFISAADILSGYGIDSLEKLIIQEDEYFKIVESMEKQIENIDSYKLVSDIRRTLERIEEHLSIRLIHEVKIGILIHICFLIDKLSKNGKETPFVMLNEFRNANSKEFILIKQCLKLLEERYNINIGEDELAHIVKMVINNKVSV